MTISASDISTRIIEALMAQKLAPGSRLGEQQLAMLFDCSRCDRVIFMHEGRVHEMAPSPAMFGNPKTPELKQFLPTLHD